MTSENAPKRLSTRDLLLILQEAEAIDPLLDDLSPQLNPPSFSERLLLHMEERGLSIAQLSEAAMLSRSFTYQLCSGTRTPGRDIILRIALALELTVDEAQRLLRAAQRGALYPRVRRDAIIIFCLNRKKGVCEADEILTGHGELPLL